MAQQQYLYKVAIHILSLPSLSIKQSQNNVASYLLKQTNSPPATTRYATSPLYLLNQKHIQLKNFLYNLDISISIMYQYSYW